MRMTNKIMQNNSLYNINNNKILQDKLSTQMATQKKLTRPSDDPIVAIRALRLRTSVSELTQYKDRNAKDADAWLNVTGDALSTASEVITSMIKQVEKGANKDLGGTDLSIIMEQIKSLRDEVYATANVDYAGRYIFTGYRTDTTLSFTSEVEDKDLSYSITEQLNITDFDSINYTDMGYLEGLNKGNYNDAGRKDVVENKVINGDIHRLRLAYDLTSSTAPTIEYTDANGVNQTIGVEVMSLTATPRDPYQEALNRNINDTGTGKAIYIPETGEILFTDDVFDDLKDAVDAGTEIRVTYNKDEWQKDDLRPEHYFACTMTEVKADGTSSPPISYNQDYLGNDPDRQKIEYDVGYNQRICINTNADEVFTHTMDRNVDDLERAVTNLVAIEATVNDLKELMNNYSEGTAEHTQIKLQLDAANKAYSNIRESVHTMFGNSITVMQKALDDINVAVTDNGTRSARLDLISNRLLSQKTTFQTLQSENEDIDITETVIQLTSTELSYEAALMATGKIMKTSLMNYI